MIAKGRTYRYTLLANQEGGMVMEETKNLCAQIPVSLHNRIRREQEQKGQTLSQYVTDVLNSYYNGGKCMENTRTMAFQISEELFQRIKEHLARESVRSGKKLTQREFILGWIEDALDRAQHEEMQ